MLQPRPSAAPETRPAAETRPPAATPPPAGRPGNRQLGDRVRSLSLASLPERRSSLLTTVAWVIGTVLLAAAGWYGYQHYVAAKPTDLQTTKSSAAPGAGESKTARAAPASSRGDKSPSTNPAISPPANKGDVVLEAKGYIVPAHQILVSPKVNGMIVKLNVEEGRRVTKGDVLAVLESTDYGADCERAKANVRLMREKLRELEN